MLVSAIAAVSCQSEIDPFEGVVRETSLEVVHSLDIFPIEGGELMLTVNLKSETRSPWSASVEAEGGWCTLSELEGKTSSTIMMNVQANVNARNKPLAPRQAVLTFSSVIEGRLDTY